MGDNTAAIVWGIPVNSLDFLCNLDAFREVIPKIHSLRLCNQFGKGENVFITRLPRELIKFIEEELLVSQRQKEKLFSHGWIKQYCCFEGSCRPSDHMDDVGFPSEAETYESMVEDALARLSHAHPEWALEEWRINDYCDLPADVQKLVDAEMADEFDSYGNEIVMELRYDNKMNWTSDVGNHMNSKGNNDVLRKHFGLDAYIMHDNLDASTIEYLKRTDTRYSHRLSQPERATICYLALPTRAAQWAMRLDPMCEFIGNCFGNSARSMFVDRDSMSLTEEHQQRFARALLQLDLKVSVHPSQLHESLAAASATGTSIPLTTQVPVSIPNQNVSVEEKTKRDEATKKRIKDLETSQWPKLMLLVSQTCPDIR